MGRDELRFKSFSERVASISVDVIHRINRNAFENPSSETHFKGVLEKWLELNCTKDFTDLVALVGPDVDTLPQLVLAKDGIFELLQHQLSKKGSRCLEPNLELVVALARDLQEDFYPQFAAFFNVITSTHLQERDAEVIEQVFTCLAYLFKFQWRFMVKDIKQIFVLYEPLLSEQHKDYIKAFAAESFAFLMRKVQNKPLLLDLVFNHADSDEAFSRGFGVLLFEMLKGVKTRLHSCAEEVFPLILRRLAHKGESTEARLTIVKTLLELLCNHLTAENSRFLWDALKESLLASESLSASHFAAICQCYQEVLSFKRGQFILDPNDLCTTFEKAFVCCAEEAFPHFLETVALVLSTCEAKGASRESLAKVLDAFVHSEQRTCEDALIEMLEHISTLECFEKSVVPRFWKYFERLETRLALQLLTKLESLAATKILCASDILRWKPLGWPEQLKRSPLANDIFKGLSLSRQKAEDRKDLERFWECCVLVRHLQKLWPLEAVADQLQRALTFLLDTTHGLRNLLLACIQECVRSLVALKQKVDPVTLMPLLKSCKEPPVLRSMDLALHSFDEARTAIETELSEELWWQLASPFAVTRFLTLRILSQFEVSDDAIPKGKVAFYRYMLDLEGVAVTVQEFKNRTNLMDKLRFETVSRSCLHRGMCRATLAFLFGQLYINFSQLWPTVKTLIGTYCGYAEFWPLLDRHLNETTIAVRLGGRTDLNRADEVFGNRTLREATEANERFENVDYDLHRVFLWNVIELVENSTGVGEVPRQHFLKLYEEEFRPRSEFIATEDVFRLVEDTDEPMELEEPTEKVDESDTLAVADEGETESDDHLEIDDDGLSLAGDSQRKPSKYGARAGLGRFGTSVRNPVKCLQAALTAFSSADLKRIENHEQLEERFTELLMIPDAATQKLALQCLFAFGRKVLLAHKDNLMKLLNDKEWMGVLNDCFLASRPTAPAPNGELHSEVNLPDSKNMSTHAQRSLSDKQRRKILPFVMRLLFGRMLTKKTGHRSKSRSVSKHAAVFRFLASSRESDLLYFIELVLLPLTRFFGMDFADTSTSELLRKVTFNPESAMPVRRLRQVLTNIRHVLSHMAGVLPNFLPLLLRAVLVALNYSNAVVERARDVNKFYLESLKRIRLRCVDIVHIYFNKLDHFAMELGDIHEFFDAYLWLPLREHHRNSNDVSSRIFRLVLCFASKERLQFLLALRNRHDVTRTIMSDLMSALDSPSTQKGVQNVIRNIVRHLLSDVAEDGAAARIQYSLDDLELAADTTASLGFRIVLPYTSALLSRPLRDMEQSKKPLDTLNRFILFKLSKYNKDSQLANSMLKVIVPAHFTGKKLSKQNEDQSEFENLAIIKDVVQVADAVEGVYPLLCRMWSSVTGREGRQVLVEIFELLSVKLTQLDGVVCDIIRSANSWDNRLAEEPDYLRRIRAFRELVDLIETMKTPNTTLALPLIHNCLYTSLTSDDLSLRDAATYALTKVITFAHDLLGEGREQFFRVCVEQEIYSAIRKGLRNTQETTRHESIKLLTHILTTCADRKLFEELRRFQDTDKEKDFFECIIHVQIHRRARALARLSYVLSSKPVSHQVIQEILLPLTESFLLKDEYATQQNIMTAAIDNLATLAKNLPWRNYVRLLEKYIALLANKDLCAVKSNLKAVVRIVVALLDAFHFDLNPPLPAFEEKNETPPSGGKLTLANEIPSAIPDVPNSLDVDMEVDEHSKVPPDEEVSNLPRPDGTVNVVDAGIGEEILITLKDLLLKRLQTAIVRKSYYSAEEDEESEENDVLRVPIAVAIVKLLSLLPNKKLLRENLPSILLKVIVFLKSRLLPVRETARGALVKIVQILGPCYLKYMIREMRSLLNRGFQLHVLSFSVHAILEAVHSQMQTGDLDECVEDLLEVCMQEQFGAVSEEKDVTGIVVKTNEARKNKSEEMFRILATAVSDEQLQKILDTIEAQLMSGSSAKIVSKCEKVLEAVGTGLETNKGLSKSGVLIFCYKLLSENTPRLLVTDPVLAKELAPEGADKKDLPEQNKLPYEKPDVYIVPKAPVRGPSAVLIATKANVHVLISTALKVLRDVLRKYRGQEMYKMLDMLNPFVQPLCNLQRCSYVKVVTQVMVVLQHMMHYPLPAFEENVQLIRDTSMKIIHKYLGTTQKSGPNYEMLIAAFKTIRCILDEVKHAEFTEDQFKLLLTYVESDICDVERQIVAFGLLGSMISKGINIPEFHNLMKKIADMSIQEPVTAIRNQARTLYKKYLFDYPIEPKLREKCVSFYLGQLEYAAEDGRQSAAEMIFQIIKLYPESILIRQNLLFFVPLAATLVNDSSVTMKKMSYECLKSLLTKLDDNSRTSLYSLSKKWLKDVSKIQKQFLGAQVLGCFAEVEKQSFELRIRDCLGVILEFLKPRETDEQMAADENTERHQDRLLYLLLNSSVKMLTHVNIFISPKDSELVSQLMDYCKVYLSYPHSWVRTAASQVFGLFFAQYKPPTVAEALGTKNGCWLLRGGRHLLDELIMAFLEQFQSRLVPSELLDQLAKNVLFVAKVLLYLDHSQVENNPNGDRMDDGEVQDGHRTFAWFVYKIEKELRNLGSERLPNLEKRTCLYKVLAALSLECPRAVLQSFYKNFLGPVVRDSESNYSQKDPSFTQLVKEVSHILRKQMGVDFYQEKYASQLTTRARSRANLKQRRAAERVLDPEMNLERREKRNHGKRHKKNNQTPC